MIERNGAHDLPGSAFGDPFGYGEIHRAGFSEIQSAFHALLKQSFAVAGGEQGHGVDAGQFGVKGKTRGCESDDRMLLPASGDPMLAIVKMRGGIDLNDMNRDGSDRIFF